MALPRWKQVSAFSNTSSTPTIAASTTASRRQSWSKSNAGKRLRHMMTGPRGASMMQWSLSISLVLAISLCSSTAEQPSVLRPDGSEIASSHIDATVTQLMQAAHVTGAGIAIFHGGKIAYLKAYGMRDVEKGLPLTPDSVMT